MKTKFKNYTKPMSKTQFGYNVSGAYFKTKNGARKFSRKLADKQQKLKDVVNYEAFKDKASSRRRKNSAQAALITQGLTTGQAVNQRILGDGFEEKDKSMINSILNDKKENEGKGDSSSIIDWL